MKKLLLGVALSLAFGVFAAEKKSLYDYVPAGSDMAVRVNAEKVNALPMINEIPEAAKFKSEFEKEHKVKVSDIQEILFVGMSLNDEAFAAVIRNKLNENTVLELLKTDKITPQVKELDGKKVYSLTKTASIEELNENLSFSFIEPGLILFSDTPNFEKYLAGMKKGVEKKIFFRPSNPEALMELYVKPSLPKDLPLEAAQMTNGIKFVYAALTASGKENRDLTLDAEVDCDNAESAKRIAMQAKMYIMMLGGMAFQENPVLGEKVIGAIKIEDKDKVATIKISMPDALRKEIQAYIQKMNENKNTLDATAGLGVSMDEKGTAAAPAK